MTWSLKTKFLQYLFRCLSILFFNYLVNITPHFVASESNYFLRRKLPFY
jgi:hypothetical protein